MLSTRTLPRWILSLKNSLTEHPALPDDAHAQAQAQLDAHAQLDAQDDAQEELLLELLLELLPELRLEDRLTGVLITLTRIYVFGSVPYL